MLGKKHLKRIGRDLTESGRYQQAIVAYQDAIRRDPTDPRLCDGLSYALYMSCRFEESIEWSKKALSLDSENYFAEKNIGLCLMQMGQPEVAVEHLEDSIRLNPRYFDSHHDLALVLMDLGRWADAKASLECAREIEPSRGPTLDRMLDIIDKNLAD